MKISANLKEFIVFVRKQAQACVFAGSFFVVLALSNVIPLFGLPRYDFLFIAAVLIQLILIWRKLETKEEVFMIMMFHIIGFCLELFKTSPEIGSWSYPEDAFTKIAGVPLYSGFMYSAVGSYIGQAWKIFKLEVKNYPKYWLSLPLAAALYFNFFTHHYFIDLRWPLIALVVLVFARTTVSFVVTDKRRQMPMVMSFALIAFFIWIAENISTYLGAWVYPYQTVAWNPVSWGKISSWFMLVILSIILVAHSKLRHQSRELKSSV